MHYFSGGMEDNRAVVGGKRGMQGVHGPEGFWSLSQQQRAGVRVP